MPNFLFDIPVSEYHFEDISWHSNFKFQCWTLSNLRSVYYWIHRTARWHFQPVEFDNVKKSHTRVPIPIWRFLIRNSSKFHRIETLWSSKSILSGSKASNRRPLGCLNYLIEIKKPRAYVIRYWWLVAHFTTSESPRLEVEFIELVHKQTWFIHDVCRRFAMKNVCPVSTAS